MGDGEKMEVEGFFRGIGTPCRVFEKLGGNEGVRWRAAPPLLLPD